MLARENMRTEGRVRSSRQKILKQTTLSKCIYITLSRHPAELFSKHRIQVTVKVNEDMLLKLKVWQNK